MKANEIPQYYESNIGNKNTINSFKFNVSLKRYNNFSDVSNKFNNENLSKKTHSDNYTYMKKNRTMDRNPSEIVHKKNKTIKYNLKSDAFPNGNSKKFLEINNTDNKFEFNQNSNIAEIHKILFNNNIKLDTGMIYYKKIASSLIPELKLLYEEWFPVEYEFSYFIKFLNETPDFFNVGAFTKIKGKEYLVGSILFKYECDGKLSDLINDTKIKRNFIARLCNPKQVGYISTIGVIEEVRKIGIGKALLSQAIGILKINKKCIGVYMHVITHNKSAINFYASNEFCRGKYLENHYFIERNHYDCIVFYKLFASNKMEIKSSETLTIRDGKEKREIENICPTFDKVIIPCVQTNLVNQEEIENKENLEILNENSSLLK